MPFLTETLTFSIQLGEIWRSFKIAEKFEVIFVTPRFRRKHTSRLLLVKQYLPTGSQRYLCLFLENKLKRIVTLPGKMLKENSHGRVALRSK